MEIVQSLIRLDNLVRNRDGYSQILAMIFGIATIFADVTVDIPTLIRSIAVLVVFSPFTISVLFNHSSWVHRQAAQSIYSEIDRNQQIARTLYYEYGQRGLDQQGVEDFLQEEDELPFPSELRPETVSELFEMLDNQPLIPDS